MTIATHLIKIKGTFDDKKWTEEQLKNYINNKIQDIESLYHADLELFQIKDRTIEVWIYIHALILSKLLEKTIKYWLKDHIKEDGLAIENFEIEKIGNDFYVLIP